MSDPIYTAQQINIPPQLPEILKHFTKAAIKTQPADLYLWAAQYVHASHYNAMCIATLCCNLLRNTVAAQKPWKIILLTLNIVLCCIINCYH